MRLPKEIDEKLRKLLILIERPLTYTMLNTQDGDIYDELYYSDAIKSAQLKNEIMSILNTPEVSGKFRQITIEEQIEEEKKKKIY